MESIRKFYSGLNRSTKITLVSCGSFLLLTILILLIFVLFPITPSERLISGLGRGGAISDSNNDNNNNDNKENVTHKYGFCFEIEKLVSVLHKHTL